MKKGLTTLLTLVFATMPAAWPAGAQQAPEYQNPPLMLDAADFVPADLLNGADYRVAGQAKNDGLINEYSVTDPSGGAVIESTYALMIYMQERAALEKIQKISKSEEFKAAFKKAGLGPYNTAKGLVTEPVDTVKKIGTGIGRWFGDVGNSIVSKDPNQPGFAKTALGQAAAKRAFAYRLDVNPYTSSTALQEALDELAWVSFAGGLTVKAAFVAIPDIPGTVISLSGTSDSMKRKVRDKSPAELASSNKKALVAMGVTPQLADEFLNNYLFDPYDKTLITGALESMRNISGRANFVWNCFGVKDRSVALFTRRQAECMAAHAAAEKSIAGMVDVGGKTFLKTGDNIVVGVFPLDYIAWTQALDQKERLISAALGKLQGVAGKRLIVYGKVDPQARAALQQRGWAVVEKKAMAEPQAKAAAD